MRAEVGVTIDVSAVQLYALGLSDHAGTRAGACSTEWPERVGYSWESPSPDPVNAGVPSRDLTRSGLRLQGCRESFSRPRCTRTGVLTAASM
jgi:hypothetical protein